LAWTAAFGDKKSASDLVGLKAHALAHCTLQLWIPDETSEQHFYLNSDSHGAVLADVPITNDGQDLLKAVLKVSKDDRNIVNLTAMKWGYAPIILTACRHYRLPIPPQFWIGFLVPPDKNEGGDANQSADLPAPPRRIRQPTKRQGRGKPLRSRRRVLS
jgi:hypothetical protein